MRPRHLIASLAIAVLVCLAAPTAHAQLYGGQPPAGVQLGFQRLNPVVSTALTIPAGTTFITVTIRAAGIHVRYDSTAATTVNAQYYSTGTFYTVPAGYQGLSLMRAIDSTDGASTVDVTYWRQR